MFRILPPRDPDALLMRASNVTASSNFFFTLEDGGVEGVLIFSSVVVVGVFGVVGATLSS